MSVAHFGHQKKNAKSRRLYELCGVCAPLILHSEINSNSQRRLTKRADSNVQTIAINSENGVISDRRAAIVLNYQLKLRNNSIRCSGKFVMAFGIAAQMSFAIIIVRRELFVPQMKLNRMECQK